MGCTPAPIGTPPASRTAARVARRAGEIARPHVGDAVDGIERIVSEGTGAERQRRTHEQGGMRALLAELVDRTAA